MSTTYDTTGLPRTFAPIKPVGLFERFRVAFREWRERRRVHATLSGLSGWELLDIGTTRGEIDYVASHRDIPGGPVRRTGPNLPTVDGQFGPIDFRDSQKRTPCSTVASACMSCTESSPKGIALLDSY
jgi:uncharacterized protein YjiS (DUF1127 family)